MNGQPINNGIIDYKTILYCTASQTESQQINKAEIEQEYLEKAIQNIEQFRKGDDSLLFINSKSKPLKNIANEINQVSQDFLFGNIAWEITGLVWENGNTCTLNMHLKEEADNQWKFNL